MTKTGLYRMRVELGILSPAILARMAGVSVRTIRRMENHRAQRPRKKTLDKVCLALQTLGHCTPAEVRKAAMKLEEWPCN